MVNKDFLKLVLAEKKKLMKKEDVVPIKVPQYDELSVRNLWPMFKNDKEFMMYFPDVYPKDKGPPREYFFNLLNSIHGDYLANIMDHANEQRMSANSENV